MRPVRRALKFTVRRVADSGTTRPFSALVRKVIEPYDAASARDSQRPALLALQPLRFRSDLELFSQQGQFRILTMPQEWQQQFLNLYYSNTVTRQAVMDPGADPQVVAAQPQLRNFLRRLIADVYPRLNIVGTLGAGVHYWRDVDWGVASKSLGYPFIVLHRENLYPRQSHRDALIVRLKAMGRFQGSAIVTHNEVARGALIESGFARPDQVIALGAMRMDGLLLRTRGPHVNPPALHRARPLVVLFSFLEGIGLTNMVGGAWSKDGKLGWIRLFEAVHVAMARMARQRPDVDFVIKVKWEGNTNTRIQQAWERFDPHVGELKNLTITGTENAHALIAASSVVIGFGSTTLLEAAVAGKPVILPLMEEAAEPFYQEYVHFGDRTSLFDVAHSGEELDQLIERRLIDPQVSADVQALRDAAFEELVSSVKPGAAQRYIDFVATLVGRQSKAGSGALPQAPQPYPAPPGKS